MWKDLILWHEKGESQAYSGGRGTFAFCGKDVYGMWKKTDAPFFHDNMLTIVE